jgi:dTDP-4-dehydrorhamnose reductase
VFDGASGPYAEDDAANPLSAYGRSKWEGECAVLAEVPRALAIRTTVVYGPERQAKNFVYQLIRHCQKGQPMRVASDQVSSPTYNVDLAQATVELCERDARGVYHLAGDGILDRYAFARLACKVFELDCSGVTPRGHGIVRSEGPASAPGRAPDRQGPGAARDAPAIARGGLARDAQGDRQLPLISGRRYLSGAS